MIQTGVVTMYACSPSEPSHEIDELQHGAFTYSLLEGFRLHGDRSCATVERLDQHLRYQVPQLDARYNKRRQTPRTSLTRAKQHLILLPTRASLQDVIQLKNDALEGRIGLMQLARRLWMRVLAASPADRQAIKAIQRVALNRVRNPVDILTACNSG